MEKIEFTTVYSSGLTIDNLYGLIDKTIEIAEPVQAKMTPLTQKAFDVMNTDKLEFELRIKKNMASVFTPELDDLHKQRKNQFSEIKRYTTNAAKSSINTMKTPGKRFHDFMKPYWNTQNKPLNTITSLFEEMLARFNASTSLLADAKTIGIEMQMKVLEVINTKYDILYKERNAEIGGKTGNAASDIKEQVVKSYEQFCTLIEQSVNLMPSDEIKKLFQKMDMLRKKYAALKSSSTPPAEE